MQAESTIIAPGGGIYRVNATFIPVFHVGAAATLFFWSRQWAATAVLLYRLAGSLGIGIGYHRLLTRRGFRTLKPVEYFLTVCGMLALHDGASNWVATNRIHHPHTVLPGVDPHMPREGRWRSHAGRILRVTLALHATWLVN
jgi:stearoyl-CoA desaturase (delta-9 desaturase)